MGLGILGQEVETSGGGKGGFGEERERAGTRNSGRVGEKEGRSNILVLDVMKTSS